jgi:signal transduction histidine kinase
VLIMLTDGTMFGTRANTPQTVGMFKLFADLIAIHLGATERAAASEARLLNECESSELREKFIAVLGHDLRDPLASIAAGTRMLCEGKIELLAQSLEPARGQVIAELRAADCGGGKQHDSPADPIDPLDSRRTK